MAPTKKDDLLGLANAVAGDPDSPVGPGGAGQLAIPAELKERVSGPNFLEAFGAAMQARGRERQGLDAGDSLDKLRARQDDARKINMERSIQIRKMKSEDEERKLKERTVRVAERKEISQAEERKKQQELAKRSHDHTVLKNERDMVFKYLEKGGSFVKLIQRFGFQHLPPGALQEFESQTKDQKQALISGLLAMNPGQGLKELIPKMTLKELRVLSQTSATGSMENRYKKEQIAFTGETRQLTNTHSITLRASKKLSSDLLVMDRDHSNLIKRGELKEAAALASRIKLKEIEHANLAKRLKLQGTINTAHENLRASNHRQTGIILKELDQLGAINLEGYKHEKRKEIVNLTEGYNSLRAAEKEYGLNKRHDKQIRAEYNKIGMNIDGRIKQIDRQATLLAKQKGIDHEDTKEILNIRNNLQTVRDQALATLNAREAMKRAKLASDTSTEINASSLSAAFLRSQEKFKAETELLELRMKITDTNNAAAQNRAHELGTKRDQSKSVLKESEMRLYESLLNKRNPSGIGQLAATLARKGPGKWSEEEHVMWGMIKPMLTKADSRILDDLGTVKKLSEVERIRAEKFYAMKGRVSKASSDKLATSLKDLPTDTIEALKKRFESADARGFFGSKSGTGKYYSKEDISYVMSNIRDELSFRSDHGEKYFWRQAPKHGIAYNVTLWAFRQLTGGFSKPGMVKKDGSFVRSKAAPFGKGRQLTTSPSALNPKNKDDKETLSPMLR